MPVGLSRCIGPGGTATHLVTHHDPRVSGAHNCQSTLRGPHAATHSSHPANGAARGVHPAGTDPRDAQDAGAARPLVSHRARRKVMNPILPGAGKVLTNEAFRCVSLAFGGQPEELRRNTSGPVRPFGDWRSIAHRFPFGSDAGEEDDQGDQGDHAFAHVRVITLAGVGRRPPLPGEENSLYSIYASGRGNAPWKG